MFVYSKLARKGTNTSAAMAIRINTAGEKPDELFLIHVEDGVAKVATSTRAHTATSSWRHEFSIGNAIGVDVEFLHEWKNTGNKYRPCTIGEPYYFIIRPITAQSGALVVRRSDTDSDVVLVPNGVTSLSVVHGWKSTIRPQDDQGIVVAFTTSDFKLGVLSYSTNTLGIHEWSAVQYIDIPFNVKHASAFRTLDYRVMISASDGAGSNMLIPSKRNYIGLGITEPDGATAYGVTYSDRLEAIRMYDLDTGDDDVAKAHGVLSVETLGTTLTSLKVLNAYNTNGNNIYLTLNIPVTPDLVPADVVVSDENNRTYKITTLTKLGNDYSQTYHLLMAGIDNAHGDVTVTIRNALNILGNTMDTSTFTFTPINLEPFSLPLPVLTSYGNTGVID